VNPRPNKAPTVSTVFSQVSFVRFIPHPRSYHDEYALHCKVPFTYGATNISQTIKNRIYGCLITAGTVTTLLVLLVTIPVKLETQKYLSPNHRYTVVYYQYEPALPLLHAFTYGYEPNGIVEVYDGKKRLYSRQIVTAYNPDSTYWEELSVTFGADGFDSVKLSSPTGADPKSPNYYDPDQPER
jgi:hypothetical protein